MNRSYQSESDLLKGCIEGKSEAWDEFVERFSKLVYWSIHKTLVRSHRSTDTEFTREIFQDIFSKLMEKETLLNLRSSESLSTFVVILSCHVTMDRMKSSSRQGKRFVAAEDSVSEGVAFKTTPADTLLTQEARQGLEAAMKTLSPKERACLEFHFFEGKTHEEIGLLFDLPTDTISSLLRRTKEKLRQHLLKKGFTDF